MKIYLDYVFFINFLFDLILLYSISIILKRNASLKRILLASLFGGLSTFLLFLPVLHFIYFFLKIISALIMLIIAFKFKDVKYTTLNLIYLMIMSVIVGGTLYLINIEFGYEQVGMIFFTNGKSINSLILFLFALVVTFIYIKVIVKEQTNQKTRYKVDVFSNKEILHLNGYLDTGNNLYDPYFNKPVLIANSNIKLSSEKIIFVPFKTLNSKGVLKCYQVDKIYIETTGYIYNVLIAVSSDKFHLPGVDIILHIDIIGGTK